MKTLNKANLVGLLLVATIGANVALADTDRLLPTTSVMQSEIREDLAQRQTEFYSTFMNETAEPGFELALANNDRLLPTTSAMQSEIHEGLAQHQAEFYSTFTDETAEAGFAQAQSIKTWKNTIYFPVIPDRVLMTAKL